MVLTIVTRRLVADSDLTATAFDNVSPPTVAALQFH